MTEILASGLAQFMTNEQKQANERIASLRSRIEKLPAPQQEPLKAKVNKLKTTSLSAEQRKKDAQEIDMLEQEIKKLEPPSAATNTPSPNAPEAKKGFLDKAMEKFEEFADKFEYWKNEASYMLAPFIMQLKRIKIPGVNFGFEGLITTFEQVVGLDTIMICSALKASQLQPAFHREKPSRDGKAIAELTKFAKEAKAKNSTIETQEFYNNVAATLAKKNTGRTVMDLEELVPIAKDISEKTSKVLPPVSQPTNTSPSQTPMNTPGSTPQLSSGPVEIIATGNNAIELKQGSKKYEISVVEKNGTVKINTAEWKLKILETDATLIQNPTEVGAALIDKQLTITEIASAEKGLQIKLDENPKPSMIEKDKMQALLQHIDAKTPYEFTIKDDGITRKLQFEPVESA